MFEGKNTKNQKAGPDSEQTIVDNHSTLKKFVGGTHYHRNVEESYGKIEEIFNFLLSLKVKKVDIEDMKKNGIFRKFGEKVKLNFNDTDSKKAIEKDLLQILSQKNEIEKYMGNLADNDDGKWNGIILRIQNIFKEVMKVEDVEVQINLYSNISKIAKECIPLKHRENSDYFPIALALVLYIFEMCDFGKKLESEEVGEVKLFS